jgi:hypothetical protein
MYTSVKVSYRLKQASQNAGRKTAWNIDPVHEYKAQSAIIPLVGITV